MTPSLESCHHYPSYHHQRQQHQQHVCLGCEQLTINTNRHDAHRQLTVEYDQHLHTWYLFIRKQMTNANVGVCSPSFATSTTWRCLRFLINLLCFVSHQSRSVRPMLTVSSLCHVTCFYRERSVVTPVKGSNSNAQCFPSNAAWTGSFQPYRR